MSAFRVDRRRAGVFTFGIFAFLGVVMAGRQLRAAEAPLPEDDPALAAWAAGCRDARPGLPEPETRSPAVRGMAADPAATTLDLLDEHVAVPPPDLLRLAPRSLTPEGEDIVVAVRYLSSDGSTQEFASHLRPDDDRPLYWHGAGYSPDLEATADDARMALVARVLGGTTEGLRVLGYPTVVDAGAIALHRADRTPVPLPWPRAWVFFVDDQPTAGWEHPCRIVFFAEDLSAFAVQYVRQPLRLVDATNPDAPHLSLDVLVPHPVVDAPRPAGPKVTYVTGNEPLAINFEGSAQNCYAVIISGGVNAQANYIRYWEDSANIYSTLTRKYGMADDHIIALISDGTDAANDRNGGSDDHPVYSNSPTDLDGDGDVDTDGPATFAEVQAAFDDLAAILTSNDQLFVYITDHGSQESGWDALVCLWGWTWLRDDQLRDMTEGLPCPVFFALETCFSGGFVDDIDDDANRVIGAACAYNDTSEGWWHFDPWVYYLTGAFRGCYPDNHTSPWVDGSSVDLSGADGRVSFREAYDHAWNNKASSDIPQLGENPVGLGNSMFLQNFHVELADNVPRTFSQITKDFSYGVLANDWAAVGIAPSSDHDIQIDDNRNMGTPLKSSELGSTTRDFVVLSGTAYPSQETLYSRVFFGAASSYTVEAEWDNVDISVGSASSLTASAGEVFDLCETTLTAGQSYEVLVDITSGNPDLSVFLYRPSQWIANRAETFRSAGAGGAGVDETVTAFVAPETGSYAIVVVNENAGSGFYSVTPRTATPLAAPTGVSASDGAYSDRVAVSWISVGGATHYRVYRNTIDDSGSASALNSWTAGTSYDDLTATVGRTYYYWVKAAAGSDGLQQSGYSSSNGGYVDTSALSDDVAQTASTDPRYLDVTETANYWWVVGARGSNPSVDDWDVYVYGTPGFLTPYLQRAFTGYPVDFVLGDGRHLAPGPYGVVFDRYGGSGNATVEFENTADTLAVGTPLVGASWPAGDVVEVWDVSLAAGTTYRFTLDLTAGDGDLNFALFGSQDGDYYKSTSDYLGRSQNVGALVDESFTYTATASDYYGLCVWNVNSTACTYTVSVQALAAGLWEGDVSTDWHTAGNWNDGAVPDASDDVTIPSGCPRFPAITSADANCHDLSIQSGASLTLTPASLRWLNINGNLSVAGTLTVNNFGKPNVVGNASWETGAVLADSGFTEIYVRGNWDVQDGSDVALADGNVYFPGSAESWIRIWDASAGFAKIICQKTGGQSVGFSYASTQPLRASRINVNSTAAFRSYGLEPVILTDSFYNDGGHISFEYGPLIFDAPGTPVYSLKLNVDDYLQDLVVSCGGTLNLDGTYTNRLVIYRDVVIESGVLDANGVNMEVGGNWDNQVGLTGFRPDGNEVFFFSGDPAWVWGNTQFSDFRDELMDDALTIVDNVVVTNWCEVMMHLVVEGTLEVTGELDLNEGTATITVPTGGSVDAKLFDMGGTNLVSGGTFSCDDIVDAGIDGVVTVSGGSCTLRQGTTAGEYLDLLGDLTVSGGNLTIYGGVGISYWPFNQEASLTVNDGVFAVPEANVEIHPAAGVSWTSTIDGGTLRFGKNLNVARPDFQPTGGTCEFDGTTYAWLTVNPTSHLHHVVVKKTGTSLAANSDLDFHGDLSIQTGVLVAPTLIELMGSWSNGVGTAGFAEGTGTVRFYGNGSSRILTGETFYDLTLDKTYGGFDGLEMLSGVAVNVGRDLTLLDGTLEMNDGNTLDIARHVSIAAGAGLNANDYGTIQINVGGNWTDSNTTFGFYVGFDPGYDSHVTFDGGAFTGTISTASTEATFNLLTINRPNGFVKLQDSATARDDLHIVAGGWWYTGGPYTYRFRGDFVVEPAGAWYDQVSTLIFDGTDVQYLDYGSVDGWLMHVIVEKNTGIVAAPLTLQSDIKLFNGGSLTVREGFMDLNGHFARCTGDVTVEDGGRLWIDAGAWIEVGGGCTFEVQSGGLLDVRGTAGNTATVKGHNGNNYTFRVYNGATLLAENAVFEFMDANGLQLDVGAVLSEPYTFHGCIFRNGVSGGTLLKLLTSQSFTARKASFPSNPGGGASNVDKGSRSGEVHFVAATGAFAGESYDDDPGNLVSWNTGSLGGLTLDAPAVATMGLSYDALATATGDLPLTPITYRWTVTDLAPQTHAHDNMEDTRAACAWSTSGAKLVSASASNELGVVTAQQVVNVQVLSVDFVGRHWVGTTNAVDLAILGTSADSTYRIQYRTSLTEGDWADAAPGGLAIPGVDGTTPWTDLGGPGRDVTTAPTLFYQAVATP